MERPGLGTISIKARAAQKDDDGGQKSPVAAVVEELELNFAGFVVAFYTILRAALVIGILYALPAGRPVAGGDLVATVAKAALAGTLAASFAALVSAGLEPVINRVMVAGLTFKEAAGDVKLPMLVSFFRTALATNLLKFPLFEGVYAALEVLHEPLIVRAVLATLAYTTVSLPTVNFRYRRSVGLPVRPSDLYAAYAPTFLRDLMYCLARGWTMAAFTGAFPWFASSDDPLMRLVPLFCAVFVGCMASAPGNELRAYILNLRSAVPKGRLREFFNFQRFARTSFVGSVTMAFVLVSGYLMAPGAEALWRWLKTPAIITAPRWVYCVLGLAAAAGFRRRGFRTLRRLIQVPSRFDRYAQQRQLIYLRLAQEGANLQVGPSSGPGPPSRRVSRLNYQLTVQMVRFVAPAFCLVAANQAMTAVDKAFVGRISSLQLAAMGSAATSFDCISYLTTFVNTAGLSLLGVALARGNMEDANKVRSHSLLFAVSLGSILGLVLIGLAPLVCRVLGGAPPGPMQSYAVAYLSIRAVGVPVERMVSIGTTFCLAGKDGTTPLLVTAVGSLANVAFDWYFCTSYPQHAAAASAGASVLAASVSATFLVQRLRSRGWWPKPFVWPRLSDFKPYLAFAGPVFLLLAAKSFTFTQLTAYASGVGTSVAAAHQIYVSLLFLTAVAVGTPLSWAAQSFLPGAFVQGKDANREHGGAMTCLRALLIVAMGCSLVAGLGAFFCLEVGPRIFTRDAGVLAELTALRSSLPLLAFVLLYPIFLALEGTLVAARRLVPALLASAVLLASNTVLLVVFATTGRLTLSTLWGSSALSLLVATCCSAVIAVRICRQVELQDRPVNTVT
eukprot:CAMPEP_0170614762 /NCGR_PEP_ID=MMETSP0224-20130122/24977_1 /TAXON_ID=285029 /ORGANISM="Togula jolla, Strain CCCM 725" /LENGTH=844 /DNA_ID=CAMNT_0010940449 /DNA_START=154 /DNA_END=2684 /DNA_ORIENTATION=-